MDSFVSSHFRHCYPSTSRISTSPTLPTIHSEHLLTASCLSDAITDKSTGTPETRHFSNSSHQYAPAGGEGPNFPKLDIALQTLHMLGRWASSSTIKEEANNNSKFAHYTGTKEWGRLLMQVGQRMLDATMRNKTLVSFLQTYRMSHTLTRPFLLSSSSSWSLALPFFIRVLLLV